MGNQEGGKDLLARLRDGDEAASDLFVRAHIRQAMAAAMRLLRDEEEARDAVQDAFSKAFEALPGFRGESKLSTWLHRIVINEALMRLRARSRRPEVPIEDLLPRFDGEGRMLAPGAEQVPDAESMLAEAESRRAVREAIGRLPDGARAVLVLRDIEELSTAEAASMLGVSANAVKIRLHRARQALRTLVVQAASGAAGATPRRRLIVRT